MAKRSDRPSRTARAIRLALTALLLLLLPLLVSAVRAQGTVTQSFDLRPGWNAIYLEVQPEPSEIDQAFAGAPIASVWTYDAKFGGKVTGVVDPARGLLDSTGWYGFFPPGRVESTLTNLFHLRVNRAYLVKLDGTLPITWTVTGEPSLQRTRWEADSFNLVGFAVDPQNPPSFGSWFEPSPAHRGQAVYRLDPAGVWQPVLPYFEPIRSGEAYWVWTRGTSRYEGPMEIELDLFDRLEFESRRERTTLLVHNHHDLATTLRLRLLPSAHPVPLKYQAVDAETAKLSWVSVPGELLRPVPAGQTSMLTLAPARAEFSGDRVEQVLEIRNGLGSRRLIAVGASTAQSASQAFASGGEISTLETNPYAGLWVGAATVERVAEMRCVPVGSRCHGGADEGEACGPDATTSCAAPGKCRISGTCEGGGNDGELCDAEQGDVECPGGVCAYCTLLDLTEPSKTAQGFDLRLIVHVDGGGNAKLLREVIQLFKAPTYGPAADTPGYQTIVDPGEYVLITNDALIPSYEGAAMRDGIPVGVRVSTVAYDFGPTTPGWDTGSHAMPMAGSFTTDAPPESLAVSIATPAEDPTNPFRHPYHPDHDNEPNGTATAFPPFFQEVPAITRSITMEFRSDFAGHCSVATGTPCANDTECPDGETCEDAFLDGTLTKPPGWGADTIGGTYSEVITGLHKNPIRVAGTFLLTRAARTAVLNGSFSTP